MKSILLFGLLLLFCGCTKETISYFGAPQSDVVVQLENQGIRVKHYDSIEEAVDHTPSQGALILTAPDYPQKRITLSADVLRKIDEKQIRTYVEYSDCGVTKDSTVVLSLERAVVTDKAWRGMTPMALLSLNSSHVVCAEAEDPVLVVGRVAGFDTAEYGLDNTPVLPLLFEKGEQLLVATSALSRFASSRFTPENRWKQTWEKIVGWLIRDDEFRFTEWLSFVKPAYDEKTVLSPGARQESVAKGIEWFFNGHFLVDPSWKTAFVDRYQGDGGYPFGPELPAGTKNGDGSLGMLEGHASRIYFDGKQDYRYWMRNDVQGESAMALSLAGALLDSVRYVALAKNIVDYSFATFRTGERADPASPSYGLLGWAITHQYVYYGDDNARHILGVMATMASTGETRWNKMLTEEIMANLRTTGVKGFREGRLEDPLLQQKGWKALYERDFVNPHPHFESWLWATYLWLYAKSGYAPLLERARAGIRETMNCYPAWNWTNGIQQERARMILPLAWLVRVDPSEEHRHWLDFMVSELLKNQVACGAIREELGDAKSGMCGKTRSNAEYGMHEAPLIANNGDPVADMLYTSNFAFFALNEAAHATGDPEYHKAVAQLSDFLTRIQVRSEKFKNVDGAWFRAFNYQNWDYWASNADAGWGAWSTLTGWIQSWIVGTQVYVEQNTSLWDEAQKINWNEQETIAEMMR